MNTHLSADSNEAVFSCDVMKEDGLVIQRKATKLLEIFVRV